jgi:hypothetical protein
VAARATAVRHVLWVAEAWRVQLAEHVVHGQLDQLVPIGHMPVEGHRTRVANGDS